MKKYSSNLIIIALSFWLGWTILVDFFLVPEIFKIVDQFWVAGLLGLTFFTKLNTLEVITGSVLVGLTALTARKNKTTLAVFILCCLLMTIAMTYFIYLSPKMGELTELWKKADALGEIKIAGYEDIQQEHQFFHRLYITIDTIKLLLLVSTLGLITVKEDSWR